jgi:hypothetical protein
MKEKIIAIAVLLLVVFVTLFNIGADKRTLINVLEYKGYEKCGDGVYRMKEVREDKDGYLIVVERSFDIKKNYGESHTQILYRMLNDRVVKESESIELLSWNYSGRHFDPIE